MANSVKIHVNKNQKRKNNKKVKIANMQTNNNNNNGNSNPAVKQGAPQIVNNLKLPPSDTKKYSIGLLNPFSEAAIGARVPDEFYAPTSTASLREFITLTNNTSGYGDVILLPNVYNPAFSTRGTIANGGSLVMRNAGTVSKGQITNTASTLYSKLTNYRIVNWGIRIRNTSSLTDSKGIVTISLFDIPDGMIVPASAPIGGQTANSGTYSTSSMSEYLKALGLPVDASDSTIIDVNSLLDYPCHMRSQAVQLAEKTFEVLPKLTSPSSRNFRLSQDSAWGTDINAQTSLAYIQPGNASYLRCDGWTGIVIGFSGGSATASTQTFDIEVVYNIEGNPNVNSGTSFISTGALNICDPIGMLQAQSKLDMVNSFKEITTGAMSAYRLFSGL
jgi:hypothetical protein